MRAQNESVAAHTMYLTRVLNCESSGGVLPSNMPPAQRWSRARGSRSRFFQEEDRFLAKACELLLWLL